LVARRSSTHRTGSPPVEVSDHPRGGGGPAPGGRLPTGTPTAFNATRGWLGHRSSGLCRWRQVLTGVPMGRVQRLGIALQAPPMRSTMGREAAHWRGGQRRSPRWRRTPSTGGRAAVEKNARAAHRVHFSPTTVEGAFLDRSSHGIRSSQKWAGPASSITEQEPMVHEPWLRQELTNATRLL